MTLPHDILPAIVFAVSFIALFAAGEWLRRRDILPPEAARKFVHVGGCAGAMLFPLFLRSPWTVVALAVVFSIGIGVAQRLWRIRSLDDVDRASDGGVLHPVALGACYLVADTFGRVADYEIAMAVLALSDTAAALVGRRYGRIRYRVEPGSERSVEGSTAFFLITFLVVHIALLFAGPMPTSPVGPLLLALLVAVLATLFEAVSWGGADNLVVPLATLTILLKNTPPDPAALGLQFALFALALALVILTVRIRRAVAFSGALAFALAAYLAAGLVAPAWGIAVIVAAAFAGRPADAEPVRIRRAFRLLFLPALVISVANLLIFAGCDIRPVLFPVFVLSLALSLLADRLDTHRRCLRRVLAVALGVPTVLATAWLAAALILSAVPLHRGAGHGGTIPVFILSNGVHADIVVPVRNAVYDWSAAIPISDAADPRAAAASWLAIGWGQRDFYLRVQRWENLTPGIALRAVSGGGGTVLHATRLFAVVEGDDCVRLDLTKEQYRALVDRLLANGVRDDNGCLVRVAGAEGYGPTDAFYEACGRYTPLFTCNTWANEALKSAGAPCCLWTPFPGPILRHTRR